MFTQTFVQAQITENIKAPHHWPLLGESNGDRWLPLTNGQQCGKCFHLMTTSSWLVCCFLSKAWRDDCHINTYLQYLQNYYYLSVSNTWRYRLAWERCFGKMPLSIIITWGLFQYKDPVLPAKAYIITIRRSQDRHIVTMKLVYLERRSLYWNRSRSTLNRITITTFSIWQRRWPSPETWTMNLLNIPMWFRHLKWQTKPY